ncbi:MAG: hypothetical protein HYR96_15910 [Deltaproteobacteria bacterium]|nr:hypothetical protein [Deltaproteobacteria bacterium]MBI3294450.1 hypothetical protein [Deltaproteobacteria bacterium]
MRKPILATLVAVAFIVSSCGRMNLSSQATQSGGVAPMSANDAMKNLAAMPMEEGGTAVTGDKSDLSAEELIRIIQENQGSLNGHAKASLDLSGLTTLLGQIQGGATTVPALANGMVNASGGSPSSASSVLSKILSVANLILPVLMFVAPQFAPIISAIISLVPVIQSFIATFLSAIHPSPTPVPAH